MTNPVLDLPALAQALTARAKNAPRFITALAGPPGAGKSTLSQRLRNALPDAAILEADGFHLDNLLLDSMGRRARKGAPDTFDVAGLASVLARLRAGGDVIVPVFDRGNDVSRGSAAIIPATARHIIVEGNYLALRSGPWSRLREHFDALVLIEISRDEIERRLTRRWVDLGLDAEAVHRHVHGNDMLNAALIIEESAAPDYRVAGD